jgi:SAM-dependent methyltransferase
LKPSVEQWLPGLSESPIEVIFGNFMYDEIFATLTPFDVIWCTGVLYHNPEQLRFVRQLFDATAPGGLLVIETATARRPQTRRENCIEVWYPYDKRESHASPEQKGATLVARNDWLLRNHGIVLPCAGREGPGSRSGGISLPSSDQCIRRDLL